MHIHYEGEARVVVYGCPQGVTQCGVGVFAKYVCMAELATLASRPAISWDIYCAFELFGCCGVLEQL